MKYLLITITLLVFNNISFSQTLELESIKKDNKWGMKIFRTNSLIIPCEYDSLKTFKHSLIAAQKNNKWGYINIKNNVVIPFTFQNAEDFKNSAAIVELNGKKGLLSLKGEFLLPPKYDRLTQQNNFIVYKKGNIGGLMDTLGKKINEYDDIDFFYKDKIPVKKDGKWGSWKDGVENMNDNDIVFTSPDLLAFYVKECSISPEILYKKDKDGEYIISEEQKDEAISCNENKFISYVYKNITYPEEAIAFGIEGLTIVRFQVDTDGRIYNIEIERDIGKGCGQAVSDILKNMPKWYQPAIKDGKRVKTHFRLPVRFRLSN